MDIRKLQRAIVDGLEDVKAQNILVFNTEHLSPLFERVIVASGQSNRQTKALAASVRDAVREGGMAVLRTEGEENGEWIIVDCGAAVAHIMQPSIRDYYRLEEIWGGKPVKIKLAESTGGLVKASEQFDDEDDEPAARPRAKSAKAAKASDETPAKKAALKTTGPRKPAQATRPPIGKTAARAAGKAPAKKTLTAREAAATKPAGSQRGVAKPAPKTAAGKVSAARTTRAGSTAVRAGAAPAKAVKATNIKKIVVPANSSRNAANAAAKKAPAKTASRGAATRTTPRGPATKSAAAKKTTTRRG